MATTTSPGEHAGNSAGQQLNRLFERHRVSWRDLRVPEEGDVVRFEANPCPAYAYYKGHTGQPIAAAVALHLVGAAH